MRILNRFSIVIIVAASLLACTGNAENSTESAEPEAAAGQISYEWRETTKQTEDELSPLGYWDVDLRYPLFASTNPRHKLDALNKQVEALRESYSCTDKGDETFTADVKFASPNLVSLIYEAMWYCPTMPSPDSGSGVINFDPIAGKSITLADLVVRDKAEALASLLAEKAQQALKGGNEACRGDSAFDQFYRDGDEVVFLSSKDGHGAEGCSISVPLKQIDTYLKQGSPLTAAS